MSVQRYKDLQAYQRDIPVFFVKKHRYSSMGAYGLLLCSVMMTTSGGMPKRKGTKPPMPVVT